MANTAVTLTSNTVAVITVDGDHDAVEVIQLAGTPVAVYYTIGTDASTTPDPVANNNLAGITIQVGYLTQEIPALSGLGLLLLSLLIGMAGFVAVRRQA